MDYIHFLCLYVELGKQSQNPEYKSESEFQLPASSAFIAISYFPYLLVYISEEQRKPRKRLTPAEALARIYKYCAYQERAHSEVKRRLYDYGLNTDEVEEIISKLITEGFLNESRYARAFAGGKFRIKKWGRIKIENELKANGVSKNCIAQGLKEIDSHDYRKTVRDLIGKKLKQETEKNPFRLKNKVARYVIGKGYEPEMVWEMLKERLD